MQTTQNYFYTSSYVIINQHEIIFSKRNFKYKFDNIKLLPNDCFYLTMDFPRDQLLGSFFPGDYTEDSALPYQISTLYYFSPGFDVFHLNLVD